MGAARVAGLPGHRRFQELRRGYLQLRQVRDRPLRCQPRRPGRRLRRAERSLPPFSPLSLSLSLSLSPSLALSLPFFPLTLPQTHETHRHALLRDQEQLGLRLGSSRFTKILAACALVSMPPSPFLCSFFCTHTQGDQGFFRMERGVNMCACSMCNSYAFTN